MPRECGEQLPSEYDGTEDEQEEKTCPDCGEFLNLRYYGYKCNHCGLMLNFDFKVCKEEDLY